MLGKRKNKFEREYDKRFGFLREYRILNPYDVFILIDNMDHEMHIVDRDFKIVFANEKKLKMHGENIIGEKCFDIFPANKVGSMCNFCPCYEVIHKKKSYGRYEQLEMMDRYGNTYFTSETATPLLNENGEPVLAINVARNLTKRVKCERIKEKFQILWREGKNYSDCVRSVVEDFYDMGYNRVRFYDIIYDGIKKDYLFVLRDAVGMDKALIGYSFYKNDKNYEPFVVHLDKPELWDGRQISREFPNCKCLEDFDLRDEAFIHLPLIAEDRLVGLISVDKKGSEEELTLEDLNILGSFANFAALAVESSRLRMNLEIITHVNAEIIKKREPEEFLRAIVKQVCKHFQARMASILIYDEMSNKIIRSATHINGSKKYVDFDESYEIGDFIVGTIFEKAKPLNVINLKEYDSNGGRVYWSIVKKYEEFIFQNTGDQIEIKNAIFCPLLFEERKVGVIRVANNMGDGKFPFPDTDLELLKALAPQIGLAVHNTKSSHLIESSILEVTNSLIKKKFDVNKFVTDVVKKIKKVSDALSVSIFLDRQDESEIIQLIAYDGPTQPDLKGIFYYFGDNKIIENTSHGIGITAFVRRSGDSFIANNRNQIVKHPAYWGKYKELLYETTTIPQSLMAEPLRIANKVIGVIKIAHTNKNAFSGSFANIFRTMSNFVALAVASSIEIQEREEFLINLGHELGTPIMGLSDFGILMNRQMENLEIIEKDEVEITEKDELEFFKMPKKEHIRNCRYLTSETHHILFLTQGRSALDYNARYKYENVSLKALINEVRTILLSTARWKYIDINYDVKNIPNYQLFLDKEKFKMAIYNVLYNAIKYSKKNGVVDIEILKNSKNYKIDFKDFGIGVCKGEEEEIFKKDIRGSNALEMDVTGLGRGLYYARLITRRHGGELNLRSLRNPTIFTFSLPTSLDFSGPNERK